MKVFGEIDKVKKTILEELEGIYEYSANGRDLVPFDLAEQLSRITSDTKRETAVYLNRRGHVEAVIVGDSSTAPLPSLTERRGENSNGRLSGLRCIHTHPDGSLQPSSVDIASLKSLKLDAMIVIGVNEGKSSGFSVSLLERDPHTNELASSVTFGPFFSGSSKADVLWNEIQYIDSSMQDAPIDINPFMFRTEKAILVSVDTGKSSEGTASQLQDELAELAETAGIIVVHKVIQKRQRPDGATFIGSGMAEELSLIAQGLNADVIILDDELSGAQIRNLEATTGVKVIDRTTLILEIFAQRAHTSEGKIQVELAQLKYRLPRLMGLGKVLSRLGGGIGTRGPGEKKLETDRRHLRRRITSLQKELKELSKRRSLVRVSRRKSSIPIASIVGYTNVGKSTLLNRLSGSDVLVENKLFATLDPVIRNLRLSDGKEVLITDTVGFIRKLPHDLVEAFKSTLEEAVDCDLLLLVADISSSEAETQIEVALGILKGLEALDKTVILVLNKCDLVELEDRHLFDNPYGPIVQISAVTGEGLDTLMEVISENLPVRSIEVKLEIPFSDGSAKAYVHNHGNVISEDYSEQGYVITATIPLDKIKAIQPYIQEDL